MKFYSEKLNQLFDSEDALVAAEKSTKCKKKGCNNSLKDAEQPVAEPTPEAPTKKQLASDVERADEKLKEAYANYEAAKAKAEELTKEYLKQLNELLDPAKKAIEVAEKEKYAAIRNFNESFGAYQVTYTGARAADEMVKAINHLNNQTMRSFKDLFWF